MQDIGSRVVYDLSIKSTMFKEHIFKKIIKENVWKAKERALKQVEATTAKFLAKIHQK